MASPVITIRLREATVTIDGHFISTVENAKARTSGRNRRPRTFAMPLAAPGAHVEISAYGAVTGAVECREVLPLTCDANGAGNA